HEGAQVLIDAEDGQEEHLWPLRCAQERGTLLCNIPDAASDLKLSVMKIWLDQPPYLGRPGMRSDADVAFKFGVETPSPFVVGDWRDIESETQCKDNQCKWNSWKARIEVKLLEPDTFCVREFKEASERALSTANAKSKQHNITFETLHEVSGYELY